MQKVINTNKHILPFTLDVEMKTLHSTAFPLGILKANIPNYDKWLCNKLIQIGNSNRVVQFECVEDDLWAVTDGAISCQRICLSPENFSKNGLDLISFNKSMLENGYYITGIYNEFFIPGKNPYKLFNNSHDYIILGFDESNMSFKSAGYMTNGRYNYFDINYYDYIKGVAGNITSIVDVLYFKVNTEYTATIDINVIKRKLHNYIYSYCDCDLYNEKAGDLCYGIDAWDQLVNIVRDSYNNTLDLRYGRFYMEHRNVMYKRLTIISNILHINNSHELLNNFFASVSREATTVYSMFLKYNLTREPALLIRIVEKMKEIHKNERKLLKLFIDQL